MNDMLRFIAPIELEAASSNKPRRLRIIAYTGASIQPPGYGELVLDLAGMQLTRPLPILDGHDDTLKSLIAQGEPAVVGKQLVIGASVLPGPAGEHTLALLTAGAALQASVGLANIQQRQLRPGEKATVNGQEFTAGPRGLAIVERSILRETSILPAGADADTSVTIAASAAQKGQGQTMPDTITTSTPVTDPEGIAALAVAQERQRLRDIDRITARLELRGAYADQLATLKAQAVAGEIGTDTLRAGCLELIRADRTLPPMIMSPRSTTPAGPDHLAAALMVRAGFGKAAETEFGANVMERSRRLHSASLVDLCKAALMIDHRDEPQGRDQLIRAAISTGSLPVALGSSGDKILVSAYRQAPASWRSFAAVKSVPNFREQKGVRPTFFGDLPELPGGGEVEHGYYEEETYTWRIGQYAKQLQIDRKDVVNDDLNVFADILPSFARAAARTLNGLVATTILANAGTFWGTGNANYFEGSGTNLQASSMATAIQKLRQMKDAEGNLLDLQPATLLVPPELETTGKELLTSTEVQRYVASGTDRAPMGNAFQNAAQLAVEPRLSDSGFTGYSTTAWWLFSDASNASVVVGFLDGREAPVLETFGLDSDINHLAFGFRVYHDFGCALADFRASIKSKGAA